MTEREKVLLHQSIFKQIADQFPAQVPSDDYQFEFIFGVKLDYRDWRTVLAAIAAQQIAAQQESTRDQRATEHGPQQDDPAAMEQARESQPAGAATVLVPSYESAALKEAMALLAEWKNTELDFMDDEFEPWIEQFTERINTLEKYLSAMLAAAPQSAPAGEHCTRCGATPQEYLRIGCSAIPCPKRQGERPRPAE